ncbi:Sec-independent protein translocase protein TatB [Candidatus Ishikawella capsulata]|uniref:Sec-independent translocase n=1 Tax=Candidatus Ishikawaella capsulata Mpkobe TaxID=476281 RepID=C5WDQ0_9ENTR|nr:Sec-independent protein translocase protein TatB [Candidatus Ishikawaella capsulata]BAH83456.1 sec-independent translocase [Candidatus Ishikawaella capsulata Mpkobe]
MFDINFSELILIFVIGLIVCGPQRLPKIVNILVRWINTFRYIKTKLNNELTKELKLQGLKDNTKNSSEIKTPIE